MSKCDCVVLMLAAWVVAGLEQHKKDFSDVFVSHTFWRFTKSGAHFY